MGRDGWGHAGGAWWAWLCPQTLTTNMLHKSLNKMANAVSLTVSLGPEVLQPHCLILCQRSTRPAFLHVALGMLITPVLMWGELQKGVDYVLGNLILGEGCGYCGVRGVAKCDHL